jgi:hypothetical protein
LWWAPAGEGIPLQGALTTQQPTGTVIDQAWVFAQLNNNATPVRTTAPWNTTLPSPDLTHYIYGADSTNPDYGAYQVAPVWWRNTYNPPQLHAVLSGCLGELEFQLQFHRVSAPEHSRTAAVSVTEKPCGKASALWRNQ